MFVYDGSYSTNKETGYSKVAAELLNKLDEETTLYLYFDSNAKFIKKEELEYIIENKKGGSGTEPNKIIKLIKDINFHGTLILLTDGQIDQIEVDKMNKSLNGYVFKEVEIWLVHTGTTPQTAANESVSCPFTRYCPHTIVHRDRNGLPLNDKKEEIVVTDENISSLERLRKGEITTITELRKNIENLDKSLLAYCIGSNGDTKLKDIIVDLKNKRIREKSNVEDNIYLNDFISQGINKVDLNDQIKCLEILFNNYYNPNPTETVEKTLDKYISWLDGSLKKQFDRSNITQREQKAAVIQPVGIETVAIDIESAVEEIECPILFVSSNAWILLIKNLGYSLFDKLNKETKDNLSNNPLLSLNDSKISSLLKDFFDSAITVDAALELKKNGMLKKSPFTRKDLLGWGGICLGNHESHVSVTNSVIQNMISNGKKLGNTDLWFAVIFFMVERGDIPYLTEYLPMMQQHMIFRLKHSKTYMCLSGLSAYPVYKVPLGHALWSVISSSVFITDPKKEPMRVHLQSLDYFFKLLKMVDYNVPIGMERYVQRLRSLRVLLQIKKKGYKEKEEIENLIDALRYNAIVVGGSRFIFIDGTPSNEQIVAVKSRLTGIFKDLEISEILDINLKSDRNKSESDIDMFPYNKSYDKYVAKETTNWPYDAEPPKNFVPICQTTCRPFFKNWYEEANLVYKQYNEEFGKKELDILTGKPIKDDYKGLSITKMFGEYVMKFDKFPTKESFLIYLSEFYYTNRGKKTLPICIWQFLEERFQDHDDIMKKLTPEEFIIRWTKSVNIIDRINMEKYNN